MKTSIVLIAAGGCVLGGVWVMAAQKPPWGASGELDALKQRIEVLEDRVAALEEGQRVMPRLVPSLQMPWQLPGQAAPEGWVPREFNGRTYYAIPITRDPNGVPSQR
jgi:hypothetical protein